MSTPPHPLDRPIWSSLTGRLAHLRVGTPAAWRFERAVNVFVAPRDFSNEAIAAVADLVAPGEEVVAIEPQPLPTPPGFERVKDAPLVQLFPERRIDPVQPGGVELLEMGDADADDLLALATLTKPGPYVRLTHRMGRFVGVRQDGRLIAMGGERFVAPGHTEISAICVHPDYQGRGLGRHLSAFIADRIYARGETPFIQAWSTNTPAVGLYQSMGFAIRRELDVSVLRKA